MTKLVNEMELKIETEILTKNNEQAEHNRKLFKQNNLWVLNVVGSPGAGKTSLLETLIKAMSELKIAVIEGDLATANDAERIRALGTPVIQINTQGGCHLDAKMIASVLPVFDLEALDILIIENVGNLVCPCDFDLGENCRMLVLSTPEGADKPQKYPNAVLTSDAVIINKTDLLPYLKIDIEKMLNDINSIKKDIPVFLASATEKEGIEEICKYIKEAKKCL